MNSFHSYRAASPVRDQVFELEQYGRPLLCTEYMARPEDSTFEAILPIFDDHSIGAYSWGLVDGRSQTKYAWDSWNEPVVGEPELWFHDVLRADGTPYIEAEADYLRGLLGAR